MSIDGSLVLNIALGVIVAKVFTTVLRETFQVIKIILERIVPRKTVAPAGGQLDPSAEDWRDLWDSLPESAKERLKRVMEDEQLRRRAQESNLWPYAWGAAPEEMKEQLRSRWKVAKVPPKVST